jgi:hypothetical protein
MSWGVIKETKCFIPMAIEQSAVFDLLINLRSSADKQLIPRRLNRTQVGKLINIQKLQSIKPSGKEYRFVTLIEHYTETVPLAIL